MTLHNAIGNFIPTHTRRREPYPYKQCMWEWAHFLTVSSLCALGMHTAWYIQYIHQRETCYATYTLLMWLGCDHVCIFNILLAFIHKKMSAHSGFKIMDVSGENYLMNSSLVVICLLTWKIAQFCFLKLLFETNLLPTGPRGRQDQNLPSKCAGSLHLSFHSFVGVRFSNYHTCTD